MNEYVAIINHWRRTWRNDTQALSIVGCTTLKEAVKTAIQKAHSPSVLRALKLNGLTTKDPRREAAAYLEEELLSKLDGAMSYEEYDSWATEVCTKLRQIYRNHRITDYTFGNAQKLLGMTVKYILSADNVKPTLPFFRTAHIPVDNEIMKIAKKKLGVRRLSAAWSGTDDMAEFLDYQIRLRNAIPEDSFPLLWECQNWKKVSE